MGCLAISEGLIEIYKLHLCTEMNFPDFIFCSLLAVKYLNILWLNNSKCFVNICYYVYRLKRNYLVAL